MGKGLAQALLLTSMQVFNGAAGIQKIDTPGYLQFLLENNKPNIISNGIDDGSGYIRDVKIRYRNRGVVGKSVTEDNCTIQVRPAYLEYTVPATQFRALGLAFEDNQIAQFEKDALAGVQLGTPAGSVMKDIYEAIVEQSNGIFGDINNDLLAVQDANWGKNKVTGLNTPRTVNFALNATNNNLASGMTMVMSDAMENSIRMSGMVAVGSGLVNNYFLQQSAKTADQAGLDTSKLALPKFYFDQYASAAWGVNEFGLFEKNAVQFLNVCRFRGAKAGEKGGDWFMTLRLPVTDSLGQASLSGYEFDVQLTYRTCPGELQIGVPAEDNPPVQLGRGWNVIIMSSYGVVHMPADSYAAADPLFGVNGTLNYLATNA